MQRLTQQQCTTAVIGLLGGVILWMGSSGLSYADHFPAEMVSTTKHNLSANTNIQFGRDSTTLGSSEVCVYCHTPHGAGTTFGSSAILADGFPPLWNRTINSETAYTTYDLAGSPSFELTSNNTLAGKIKGVSLACLSCHDGTIAFDALINLQGSGGYQPLNTNMIGAGGNATPGETDVATTMFGFGFGENVDTSHSFGDGIRSSTVPAGANPFGGSLFENDTLAGTGAGSGAAPFPNLTADLRDDHPISFQIPSGTDDPQFDELVKGSVADGNGKLLYLTRAINTGSTGGIYPVDKRDRLRAYTSAGSTVSTGSETNAYIECASCHNPHTPRTLFLRLPSNVDSTGLFNGSGTALPSGGGSVSYTGTLGTSWSHAPNQASAICISCHQK